MSAPEPTTTTTEALPEIETGQNKPKHQLEIEEFLNQHGFKIIQNNAQRISVSSENSELDPAQKYEVFLGRLPPDADERELVPFLMEAGQIHTLRLMVNHRGCNRGFGFVTYMNPSCAQVAIRQLSKKEFRPHKRITVVKSIDNRRLFIGGIPLTATAADVKEELSKKVEHVNQIILYPSAHDPKSNRGFAFIEFNDHKSAAIARTHLRNPTENKELFSSFPGSRQNRVQIDWAALEPQVDVAEMEKVTNLFVRNVSLDVTENDLKQLFSLEGQIEVTRVRRPSNFAFVHYAQREHATEALQKLQGIELKGQFIEIEYAKPPPRERNFHNGRDRYRSRPVAPRRYVKVSNPPELWFSTIPPGHQVAGPAHQALNGLVYQLYGISVRIDYALVSMDPSKPVFRVNIYIGDHKETYDLPAAAPQFAVEEATHITLTKLHHSLATYTPATNF